MARPKLTDEQREQRKREKAIRESQAKVQAQKAQKPVKRIDISIEWKKGTYGYCPTAQARVWFHDDSHEVSKHYRAGGMGMTKNLRS